MNPTPMNRFGKSSDRYNIIIYSQKYAYTSLINVENVGPIIIMFSAPRYKR